MLSNHIKILLGLIIIAAAFPLVMASPAGTDTPHLKLLLEEVTPEPVEPGQDVTVKIRILNKGGEAAKNVSVKLHADNPFYLKTTSEDPTQVNDLCIGCSMDNTYYLTVDADAKSGLYPLTFDIIEEDFTKNPLKTVDIKVVGKPQVILQTESVEGSVSPGDTFRINFTLDNIGTGIARNIRISPDSERIMMLGSNIRVINEIQPGKKVSFTSEFTTKEELKPETYTFPVDLQYSDEQSASYADTFQLGTRVLDKADIGIQSIKITPSMPSTSDQVHLEGIIENTGGGEANDVTVELIKENKRNKAFLGQLKADDDAPFYFDMKPEESGINKVRLKISYRDDFGSHEFERTLEQEVLEPKNNLFYVLAVLFVVAVGLGYYFYRRK